LAKVLSTVAKCNSNCLKTSPPIKKSQIGEKIAKSGHTGFEVIPALLLTVIVVLTSREQNTDLCTKFCVLTTLFGVDGMPMPTSYIHSFCLDQRQLFLLDIICISASNKLILARLKSKMLDAHWWFIQTGKLHFRSIFCP